MDQKETAYKEMFEEIEASAPYKIVLSNSRCEYRKLVFQRKIIRGQNVYQLEKYTEKQVFHENLSGPEAFVVLEQYFPADFRQMNVFSVNRAYDVKAGKKGNFIINRREVSGKQIVIAGNNREKRYLLEEGMDIPVFRELGIFTGEGKVVSSMYDKFRQINRFVEIVDSVLKDDHRDTIRIIDFGCGKSYLTFILYYYIVEIRHMHAQITGLDLKEPVIRKCNELARRFGYKNLNFELGDISGYQTDQKADMVVTLHACDVATDYALHHAIAMNADYILSVPCCQHELNAQISSGYLSALTKYGIIKERTAALMTDAIRGCVLESCGYKTDLLEFIDMEHSPKNILIRGIRRNVPAEKREEARREAQRLCQEFHLNQTLMRLTEEIWRKL